MGNSIAIIDLFIKPFKEPFIEPLQSRYKAVYKDDAAVCKDNAEPFVQTIVEQLYKQ